MLVHSRPLRIIAMSEIGGADFLERVAQATGESSPAQRLWSRDINVIFEPSSLAHAHTALFHAQRT